MFRIVTSKTFAEMIGEEYIKTEKENTVIIECANVGSFLEKHDLWMDDFIPYIKLGMYTVGRLVEAKWLEDERNKIWEQLLSKKRKYNVSVAISKDTLEKIGEDDSGIDKSFREFIIRNLPKPVLANTYPPAIIHENEVCKF